MTPANSCPNTMPCMAALPDSFTWRSEPQMDEVLYETILEGITESGYDLAPLVKSVQPEG